MTFRGAVNFTLTMLYLGVFGFLAPLTLARRITAIGVLACLIAFFLAASAAAATFDLGLFAGMAAWGAINVLSALLWLRLSLYLTHRLAAQHQT